MAAPFSKTVTDLNGTWILNRKLSDDLDKIFAVQGMSWINRKVLSLGRITLRMAQEKKNSHDKDRDPDHAGTGIDSSSSSTSSGEVPSVGGGEGVYEVRQLQTVDPGGFATEDVYLVDGETRESTVPIWGRVASTLRMCGSRGEVESGNEMFKDGWVKGDDAAAVIEEKTVSVGGGGWTSVLVWGFEEVAGERRFTQRCVTVKGDVRLTARVVYDYIA